MEKISNGAASLNDTFDDSEFSSALRDIRAVTDNLPQLAWSCLPNGHCDYLSRGWVEFTGVPEEEHHGRGWLDALHPEDREQTRDGWEAFILGLGPYDVDYRLRRHDGAYLWFKTRGVLIRDADGLPMRVVGTTTDIDAQKRAEQMYRESRERLEAALAASGTGTFRWDIMNNVLEWDQQLDRLFGLPPGKTVRSLEKFVELVHPDDRDEVIERCRRCKDHGADFAMEFRVVWPDGSIHWLDDHGRTFVDAAGEPASMTGACVDITERKLAEERMHEIDERAAFVRKASGVGFWYCDLPFDVLEWDEQVKEHFHLPPDALVTIESFYDRIHPDDRERTRAAIDKSIATREPYDVCYRTVHPRTGAEKWIRAIGRTFYAADGTPRRFDGVTLNVTDQKKVEEQLHDADRRKDEFLALLAHELRNPLAPLRNGLQVMRLAGSSGEAADETRAMMERQLAHMVRLIDDLLDVTRISRNKMELRRERVLLTDVVSSAVETARPAIDAAGHELLVALPSAPVYLNADLMRLAQVLSNLLTNAAKYTEERGRIWLSATLNSGEVVVAVRDTGIGIPAQSLPTIFDMFSQADRSMERTRGGLGIGLALVKGLVEMHGGCVTAESGGDGQGSTFTVTLPREQSRRLEQAATPVASAEIRRGPCRRILVVDDNRDSAASMAAILKILGHDVRTAFDGEEAIAAAEQFKPAVILMDVGLPKLNGYEATRRIREAPWATSVTILAVTGWGQEDDRAESRSAGCDGHLVKPVQLEELLPFLMNAADF